MGFSTSGAVAIMLIGFLLAAGVLFPTVFTAGSNVGDAFSGQSDQTRDLVNTDIELETVETVNNSSGDLESITVVADNRGTTALDVMKTDLMLNGEYVSKNEYETAVAEVNASESITDADRIDTDVWYPGSRLEIRIDQDPDQMATLFDGDELERVKLVTEHGISDTTEEIR
ncbi:flagellin [Halostagnicola kamekurae]|uniref:Flagellar protein FlaF n=1 Tax=Halostagnicola kamekurae TaxID=619731 RepID=A0A1I6RK43_9EURY|nr:flagellin [Halostagnicola kamekurae]SFS65091.1 flagellar protein FlaF [Halostagnicola kamekurae]